MILIVRNMAKLVLVYGRMWNLRLLVLLREGLMILLSAIYKLGIILTVDVSLVSPIILSNLVLIQSEFQSSILSDMLKTSRINLWANIIIFWQVTLKLIVVSRLVLNIFDTRIQVSNFLLTPLRNIIITNLILTWKSFIFAAINRIQKYLPPISFGYVRYRGNRGGTKKWAVLSRGTVSSLSLILTHL